jgi:hypothetical protein
VQAQQRLRRADFYPVAAAVPGLDGEPERGEELQVRGTSAV